jgi:HAE1 family hydrophobic/amphiphilic exporter-1
MILWPGADADSIERLVTEPVEEACELLADVNTISSVTYDNYMMMQLQYDYDVDMDDAYMELKAAMDNLKGELPNGCEDATIMEISMTASATMTISASGDNVQSDLEDTVIPDLESVSGVAQVEASGTQEEYVRIVLDEAKLHQYGLSILSVGAAVAAADFDMPVGSVTIGTQEIVLSATGAIDVRSMCARKRCAILRFKLRAVKSFS